MYKTRLNPPPAYGWTPPPHLLEEDGPRQAPRSSTVVEQGEADDFQLVAPEPPQPRFDFATAGPERPVQRLTINGESAIFVRKKKENGKLFITARMDATGAERTFTVPPAKVIILGSNCI